MAKDRDNSSLHAGNADFANVTSVNLEFPLPELCGTEYLPRGRTHLEVQLGIDEAKLLKRMQVGLQATGARLPNGRFVSSRGDVIRFLLWSISRRMQ